jgi:hypothetical protein
MDVVVSSSVVVNNHISVRAAAEHSGYSLQYIRLLLRCGKLAGLKNGQVWLIERDVFLEFYEQATNATDWQFGPQ